MTYKEAFLEVIAQPKFYVGVYPQSTASRIVKRFREDRITTGKIKEFLNKFGYVEREGEWIKIKVEKPRIKYKFG